VGLVAALAKTPLVLAEADSHLGLTNRALARRARRVCLAFPIERRDDARYRVTGRAVPPTFTDGAAARAELGLAPDETVVLVFGGSLGARSINEASIEAFSNTPYRVLHVAGRRDFELLRPPGERYLLRDYITPFGEALAAADVAVARSGGSVFELAQYGLPAVLIPYPHASADHQTTNARWMEDAGAATTIRDAELTPERLRAAVDAIALDDGRRAAMAAASRALARPDAARDIAAEVLAAARS
jgi:UDP-N-acetylglucosamine--N-acetylmuramyl-(pentapeptide) pyrophosphoryl-undecaprenol N-acetylglucosamine transferase